MRWSKPKASKASSKRGGGYTSVRLRLCGRFAEPEEHEQRTEVAHALWALCDPSPASAPTVAAPTAAAAPVDAAPVGATPPRPRVMASIAPSGPPPLTVSVSACVVSPEEPRGSAHVPPPSHDMDAAAALMAFGLSSSDSRVTDDMDDADQTAPFSPPSPTNPAYSVPCTPAARGSVHPYAANNTQPTMLFPSPACHHSMAAANPGAVMRPVWVLVPPGPPAAPTKARHAKPRHAKPRSVLSTQGPHNLMTTPLANHNLLSTPYAMPAVTPASRPAVPAVKVRACVMARAIDIAQ